MEEISSCLHKKRFEKHASLGRGVDVVNLRHDSASAGRSRSLSQPPIEPHHQSHRSWPALSSQAHTVPTSGPPGWPPQSESRDCALRPRRQNKAYSLFVRFEKTVTSCDPPRGFRRESLRGWGYAPSNFDVAVFSAAVAWASSKACRNRGRPIGKRRREPTRRRLPSLVFAQEIKGKSKGGSEGRILPAPVWL